MVNECLRREQKKKRPVKIAYAAMFWQNLKPDSEWGKMCILAAAVLNPGVIFSSVLEETVFLRSVINPNTS